MCFAFQAANPDPAVGDPYAEVDFALSYGAGSGSTRPVFVLAIQSMSGLTESIQSSCFVVLQPPSLQTQVAHSPARP